MEANFSQAGPGDEELVLQLMEEFYAIEHLSYDLLIARRALHQLWKQPSLGQIHLIRTGQSVVGYVVVTFGFSLERRGRTALVDELYVREAFRGHGIGKACLERVEAVCRDEGIHAMHLEVDHANVRAKQLYHRMGYIDLERHFLTKVIGA